MSISLTQSHIIVVFATLFILLGSGAPVIYAESIESQENVQISNFKTEDVVTQTSTHTVCFEKNKNQKLKDKSSLSMYMLSHNSGQMHKIPIQEDVHEAMKNGSVTSVDFSTSLPPQTYTGKHSYMLVIDSHGDGGTLSQTKAFMSDEFSVVEDQKAYTSEEVTCK